MTATFGPERIGPLLQKPTLPAGLQKPTLPAGPQDSPPSVGRVALPGRGESGLWFGATRAIR
jgi:hypothetical protein